MMAIYCWGGSQRFMKGLHSPFASQGLVLSDILKDLALTDYGRSLGVASHDTYAAFAQKVPVVGYEELAPWIKLQQQGRTALTSQKVLLYETTSGSSGASKSIPYTGALKSSFMTLFKIWVYDFIQGGLRLKYGKIFMSLSQPTSPNHEGMQDDRDYLDPVSRLLLKPFLVFSPSWDQEAPPEDFIRELAITLLYEPHLEVISIWSPSYLLEILRYIEAHREVWPEPFLDQGTLDWKMVWPDLKLISCWASASAEKGAQQLQDKFPGVWLQGKGLLATEAPLTLPLREAEGCVPMLTEVFLEGEDTYGEIKRLHEFEEGERYSLIISQKGGLVRYRMEDFVEVTSFYRGTPCLAFRGRTSSMSDMVGEKLHEEFVRCVLTKLGVAEASVLVPQPASEKRAACYILLTEAEGLDSGALDALLSEAYHYKNARILGQVREVQIHTVGALVEKVRQSYTNRGMKWGDIKESSLITQPQQAEALLRSVGYEYSRKPQECKV